RLSVGFSKNTPGSGYTIDSEGDINISSGSYKINGSDLTTDDIAESTSKKYSQWTTSGTNISYTLGNLGVGTASPSQRVHIYGNLRIEAGWVAIGATYPSYPLDVSGQCRLDNALIGRLGTSTTTYAQFMYHTLTDNSTNYALLQDINGVTFLNASANKNIHFRINNGTKAIIDKDGKFGINTTSPSQVLHVNGNAKVDGYIHITHNTDPILWCSDNSGHRLIVGYKEDNSIMQNSLTAQILVDSSGNIKYISRTNNNAGHYFYSGNGTNRVYIGQTPTGPGSTRYLSLAGEGTTSDSLNGISIKVTGAVWATGVLLTTSDNRIKKNIVELEDDECLSVVRKLNPCKYKYIDSIKRSTKDIIGFIAQEVEAVFPQATTRDNTEYIPSNYEKCEVADDIIKTTKLHEFI
ncbi:hypothetical protein T484DRAFT_1758515, partial [Baffinella frigidus]